MARKTALNAQLQAEIVECLSIGMTIKDTCCYVNITEKNFYEWCKRGETYRSGNELFCDFREAVTRARVLGRRAAVAVIRTAITDKDAQAAEWFLERTDPVNWGKRTYVKLEGGLTVDDINKLVRAIEQRGLKASDVFNDFLAQLAAEHPVSHPALVEAADERAVD